MPGTCSNVAPMCVPGQCCGEASEEGDGSSRHAGGVRGRRCAVGDSFDVAVPFVWPTRLVGLLGRVTCGKPFDSRSPHRAAGRGRRLVGHGSRIGLGALHLHDFLAERSHELDRLIGDQEPPCQRRAWTAATRALQSLRCHSSGRSADQVDRSMADALERIHLLDVPSLR